MTIDRFCLESECKVFTTYLIGQDPTRYVMDRYLEAHRLPVLSLEASGFEGALVSIARRHSALTRVADAYSRLFAPHSVLRSKLVLLLALLETSSPSFVWIDDVPATRRAKTLASVICHLVVGMACLLVGLIVFTPIRVLMLIKKAG